MPLFYNDYINNILHQLEGNVSDGYEIVGCHHLVLQCTLQKITGIPTCRFKGKEYIDIVHEKRKRQTIHVTLINNSRLIEAHAVPQMIPTANDPQTEPQMIPDEYRK